MIRATLAMTTLVVSMLMAGTAWNPAAAQRYGTACPPGYDGSSGYCVPNSKYPPRGHRYGTACPPGYDGSSGRCIPNRNLGFAPDYYGGYEDHRRRRGGVPCPPGYNAYGGQCNPNR